jgi:hypothetical protein
MIPVKQGGKDVVPMIRVYLRIIFGRMMHVIKRPLVFGYPGFLQRLGSGIPPIAAITAGRGGRAGIYRSLGRLMEMGVGFAIAVFERSYRRTSRVKAGL